MAEDGGARITPEDSKRIRHVETAIGEPRSRQYLMGKPDVLARFDRIETRSGRRAPVIYDDRLAQAFLEPPVDRNSIVRQLSFNHRDHAATGSYIDRLIRKSRRQWGEPPGTKPRKEHTR
jgi:hypothetical protein